ncbi:MULTISPECIES: two-component system regulatory protein YycI [unclassified Jeotgalibaca]|uniref:two-component system regulatory protein YycI n=1 Tax=unclassified Jeotgalibaca TaxID=2621505 RepID=UPI003FD34B35
MDYKRIQVILIITFSILNIYLLAVFLEKNDELNFGDPSATVNLEEGLRNDKIESPELSREAEEIPVIKTDKNTYLRENAASLKNQTTRMENNLLFSVLSDPIALDFETDNVPLSQRLEPIQVFIDDGNVLNGYEYAYLSYQAVNQRVVYVQYTKEGIPIADGTASLIFHLNSDHEVISYEQTYVGSAEPQGRQRNVISEQAAIESLYLNNQIPDNSTIRLLTLSYYQTLSLTDMNIYSPMWYVEIARENVPVQIKRVDALTGNIISAPVVQEEEEEESSEAESEAETENVVSEMSSSTEPVEELTERLLISE